MGSGAPKAQCRKNKKIAQFCPDWSLATGNPIRFARPTIECATWKCRKILRSAPGVFWGAESQISQNIQICKTLVELAPGYEKSYTRCQIYNRGCKMWTFVEFDNVPPPKARFYTNPEFTKFCPDRPLAIAAPSREAFPQSTCSLKKDFPSEEPNRLKDPLTQRTLIP